MISDADMAAIRADGDLKTYLQGIAEQARAECARRRALINRHPDLAAKLAEIPGQTAWNGHIPPATWNGAPNNSPIRTALLELVAEAEAREAPQTRAA